jgi:hypothetical protein
MQLILSLFGRRIPANSQVRPVGILYNMLVESCSYSTWSVNFAT